MPSMMNAQSSTVCSIKQMSASMQVSAEQSTQSGEAEDDCGGDCVSVSPQALLSSPLSLFVIQGEVVQFLNNTAESVLFVSAESGDGIRLGENLSG